MSLEHETLASLFNDIADAIRSKTGSNASIQADDFPSAIEQIDVHQGVETNKSVTITSTSQVINPSSGYSSMAKVTASVAQSTIGNEANISGSGQTSLGYGKQRTISAGFYATDRVIKNGVSAMTLPSTSSGTASGTQKAVITPANIPQYINIPSGYNGSAVYYKINAATPSVNSFTIEDYESHYYGQGYETYPMFQGMTWAMAINQMISFYGIPIEKDGGWIMMNDGPYAGRPLMDSKYNVVDPGDYIEPGETYRFENE